MKLTYNRDRDDAYVEFVSDWKGTDGGSNMALLPMDGPELEAHFFVTLDNSLQAILVRHASRWFSAEVLDAAEPFEPWDGVDRSGRQRD